MVKRSYSTKGRTTYHETRIYDEILYDLFMITKQQDTLAKSGHIMRYGNIIGGLDYEPSSKTMYKGAAFANNSKLINHRQNQRIYPQKELTKHSLQKAQHSSFSKIFTNDSDFRIKLSLIEVCNSPQEHLSNY